MKKTELFVLLTSFIFILSAIGKSISCYDFAHQIIAIGFPKLWFLAPVITCLELFIGLSLLFKYRVKSMSYIGLCSIIVFTAVYVYGWIVNGITDCGCFGKFNIFDGSPWLIIVRNSILIYLLLYIGQLSDCSTELHEKSIIFCVLVLSLCAFMTGYSLHNEASKPKSRFDPIPINESPLNNYISTSTDSTYLVFAFSYTCPHCINSISHLQEYEAKGVVDHVIGLAADNEDAEKEFNAYFNPKFEIHNIPSDSLFKLTKQFPVTYFIRRDSISNIIYGELPSAYFLKTSESFKK